MLCPKNIRIMSHANKRCIYNKNVLLSIIDKNHGQIMERNLNLKIISCDESLVSVMFKRLVGYNVDNFFQDIKLNDPLDYYFNYNASITCATYTIMRVNQNLDINFSEFNSNLLEMLEQFHKRELLGHFYNQIFL